MPFLKLLPSFFPLALLAHVATAEIPQANKPANPTATKTQTEDSSQKQQNNILTNLPLSGLPSQWIQGQPITAWEKDKVYIFEFWATWCGPCIAAMPHMQALHEMLEKEKLPAQIIGINVFDQTPPDKLKQFLSKQTVVPQYTMGADGNQSGNCAKQWLAPLKVKGIPFTLIVKNGHIIWKGHPSKLQENPLRQFITGKTSAYNPIDEQARTSPQVEKELQAISNDYVQGLYQEGENKLGAFLANSTYTHHQKCEALSLPLTPLLAQQQYKKLNQALQRKANLFPEVEGNIFEVVDFILNSPDLPKQYQDLELAEKSVKKFIQIKETEKHYSMLPWETLGEIYLRQNKPQLAIQALENALSLSPAGKKEQRILDTLVKNEPTDQDKLLKEKELRKNITPLILEKNLKKSPLESPPAPYKTIPSTSSESKALLSLLQSLDWIQGKAPESIPQNGLFFIELWTTPHYGPRNNLFPYYAPGGRTKAQMGDFPYTIISLCPIPTQKKRAVQVLNSDVYKAPGDVAVCSWNSLSNLLLEPGHVSHGPAIFAIRDGQIIWAGNPSEMPEWVRTEASKKDFNFSNYSKILEEKKANFKSTFAAFKEARQLLKENKPEEAMACLNKHRAILDQTPSLACMELEFALGKPYSEHNYAEINRQCATFLAQHKNDAYIADRILTILTSSPEIKEVSYQTIISCAQQLITSNTKNDGNYDAACWLIISDIYAQLGDLNKALNAAHSALMASTTYQRLSSLQKRNIEAQKPSK